MSDYKINIKIAGQLEKSFSAAMKAANVGLKGLSTLGKVGAAGLGAAGAAVSAMTAASIKTGSTFEAAMSSTAATAGATTEEYDKLKAAAMQMGRETSKTATESAQALEYMSLAGWTVDQSIQGLPSVLRLSEATGLDLARTSDLVTDSMSACGVTVDGLSDYLNICAKANNKSNQTAEQLMEAYIGVGGTMKNLGVPIEESATALGVMANRGIKGSEAGNALNAVMVNLTSGTGQAGTMMESLGLSAFDSEGKFKGLKETLLELNNSVSGMTEEQRNATLSAIGGKQHLDALNDLLAGLNDTTADGTIEWDALSQQLQNADGALEEMAHTKLDNLNGDVAIFQSALEDTGIKIYDNLNKPLREAVQYGTQEIYQLSDALLHGGFTGFASEIGNVLADTLVQVAAYGPKFVVVATTMVASFLNGIRSNAAEIASGAVSIGASFVSGIIRTIPKILYTGTELLGEFLKGAETKLPEVMTLATNVLNQFSSGITAMLPDIADSAVNVATLLINGLGDFVPELITLGADVIVALADGLSGDSPELVIAIESAVSKIIDAVAEAGPKLLQAGVTMASSLAKGALSGITNLFSGIGNGSSGLAQAFTAFTPILMVGNKLVPIFTKVSKVIKAIGPAAKAGFKAITSPAGLAVGAITVLAAAFMQLWSTNEGFRNAITGIWNQIKGTLSGAAQSIVSTLNGIGFNFQDITEVASAAWNGFCDILAPVFVGAFQIIADTISAIIGVVSGIIQTVSAAIQGDWSGAMEGIRNVTSTVWNFILSIIDTAGSAICDAVNTFLGMIGVDWQVSWDSVKNVASDVWTGIQTAVEGGLSVLQGIISIVMDIIHGDWSGAWETIKGAASTAADALPGLVSGGLSLMQSAISTIGSTLGVLLDAGWEALKSAASAAA